MIDPSIPLQVQPPQSMGLAEMLFNVQKYQAQQQANQWQATRQRELERGLSQRDQIEAIVRRNNGDFEKSLPEVIQVEPTLGMEWKASLAKAKREHQTWLSQLNDDEFNKAQKFQSYATDQLRSLEAIPEDQRTGAWPKVQQNLSKAGSLLLKDGLDMQGWPATYDQPFVKMLQGLNRTHEDIVSQEAATRKRNELRDVAPGHQVFDPATGAPIYTAPHEPPKLGTEEGFFDQYAREHNAPKDPTTGRYRLTQNQQADARQQWEQSKQADEIPLSDSATDMLARGFATTGTLPPMGFGKQAQSNRRQVIERAAESFPTFNPGQAKAEYTANVSSLGKIQGTLDALDSFEGTALKNLELFKTAATQIRDSGSPAINSMWRTPMRQITGSPELARFNVDRQSIVNEFARIISQPSLSGVLSDSARHEAAGLLKEDATLAEMYATADELVKEAKNRKGEQTRVRDAIKQRIKRSGVVPDVSEQANEPQGIAPDAKRYLDTIPDAQWHNPDGSEKQKTLYDSQNNVLGVYVKRNGQYVKVR